MLFWSLALCIFGSGCQKDPQEQYHEQALEARTQYLALQQATALCDVTADYGERVYEFSFLVSVERGENKELKTTLSLTAPEEIAGITVTQVEGSSQLLWEDMILETGDLNERGLSPVSAVPELLQALCSAYIHSVNMREENSGQSLLELYCTEPEEGQEIYLWLDRENFHLVGGEILQEGRRVILCEFRNFAMSNNGYF